MELYLHLAEREPIRQSYFRDWFFFLKDRNLYLKEYAWGRLQKDEVYKVSLQDKDYQLLLDQFQRPEYREDLDSKNEVENSGDLHHHYRLLLKRDRQLLHQRVGATQSTFTTQYAHLPALIQLLKAIAKQQQIAISPAKNTHGDFSLKLHIHESYGRSKASTRTYILKEQKIRISTWQKGSAVNASQEKYALASPQWNQLLQVFKSEWSHIQQIPDLRVPRPSSWNSAFHCQLSLQENGLSYEKEIKGMRNQLHRQLGFIALQILEKQINTVTHQAKSPLLTINH